MIITHSSLECFKACRQKYKYRYMDGIVPKRKSAALEFGSAMHAVLEQYFNFIKAAQVFDGMEPEDVIRERCEQIVDDAGLETVETAKLMGLILGYISRWYKTDVEELDVIDVEKEFNNTKLLATINFVGKVDGLVRRKSDGKYFILEHKTASVVDESYVAQKQIDSQTMTYAICLEDTMEIEIGGVIHDIITKQKIRLKKGESESDFCERLIDDVTDDNFTRIVIEFAPGDLDDFRHELYNACNDLDRCGNFYKCTGSCIGRYGACEYLPLCKAGGLAKTGGIVGALTEMYETARAHEEISIDTLSSEEV